MPKPPRHPYFWLVSFIIWFGVLWFLSSRTGDLEKLPPIPFLDKIAHFGFFFGGGGLLSAFLYTRKPENPRWAVIILTTFIVIGIVGAIDEYHQHFTPGRFGNDPLDWLADVTGAIFGSLVFKRLHFLLKP